MLSLSSAFKVLFLSGLLFGDAFSKLEESVSNGDPVQVLINDNLTQPNKLVSDSVEVNVTFHKEEADNNVGARLILTELIESGNITGARALAEVKGGPFPAYITSYSGFFTVDHRFNSNLFFWFFPAQTNYENSPVILWLSGGPGESSTLGLFNEIGPFTVDANGTNLIENPYSWHNNYSLIFIDNPVGTGFSFTESSEGFSTNQTHIGNSLLIALKQFFTLFPELQGNEFFIAGDSYAGKYIPALGHTIHTHNPVSPLKINLKGIAVGNGFTDPICMVEFSEFVYQLGLVDTNLRNKLRSSEENIIASIRSGDFDVAITDHFNTLGWISFGSGFKYLGNILQSEYPANFRQYETFIQSPKVRGLIHVGNGTYFSLQLGGSAREVFISLLTEYMVSVKPYLEELLEHYRVLYYSGQLDIIVGYPMSVCMYQNLNWSATEEYRQAQRHAWYVGGDLAGYMKSAGKFTEVLVRNAGHMVPLDQPAWTLDLITRFISNNFKHQQSEQ